MIASVRATICLLTLLWAACFSVMQGGELRLAGGIFDHMVLQRQVPVRICGQAAAGVAVSVSQPQGVWYECSQRGKYRLFLASGLRVGTFRPDSGLIPQDQIRK